MFAGKQERDRVARLEKYLPAHTVAFELAGILAGVHIFHEAVRAGIDPRNPDRDRVRKAGRSAGRCVNLVVTAIADFGTAVRNERRVRSLDQDRATGCIASEQRSLRTLENLDGFEVAQLEVGRELARTVNSVDVSRDVGREAHAGSGAAYAADGRLEEGARKVETKARHDLAEFRSAGDPRCSEAFPAYRRNRDRNIDLAFVATLRRDDDFTRPRLVVWLRLLARGGCVGRERGLRKGRRRNERCQRSAGKKQRETLHDILLHLMAIRGALNLRVSINQRAGRLDPRSSTVTGRAARQGCHGNS